MWRVRFWLLIFCTRFVSFFDSFVSNCSCRNWRVTTFLHSSWLVFWWFLPMWIIKNIIIVSRIVPIVYFHYQRTPLRMDYWIIKFITNCASSCKLNRYSVEAIMTHSISWNQLERQRKIHINSHRYRGKAIFWKFWFCLFFLIKNVLTNHLVLSPSTRC